ncbi:hypothetical protein Salat_0517200 [Sesamum alatum]|uniref:Uncharacterized protein n=1 Tax=Sesamum alatum TaxID=300844 RepID=A0AAE1Z5I6_9LAMI|nr:hypothetical protein Salat_0517200 [Sesamum alatum]
MTRNSALCYQGVCGMLTRILTGFVWFGGFSQHELLVAEAKLARESGPARRRGATIFGDFSELGRSDSTEPDKRGEAPACRVGVAAAENFSLERLLQQAPGVGVATGVSEVRTARKGPAGAEDRGIDDLANCVPSTIPECHFVSLRAAHEDVEGQEGVAGLVGMVRLARENGLGVVR